MKEVRELMERIRGFQVGDYVRIIAPDSGKPLYGVVLETLNWINPLTEEPERLVKVFVPKINDKLFVPLDCKLWKIRLSRRRKK